MNIDEIESKIQLADSLLGLMQDPRWDRFATAADVHRKAIVNHMVRETEITPAQIARFQGEVRMLEWLLRQKDVIERDLKELRSLREKHNNTSKLSDSTGAGSWGVSVPSDRPASFNPFSNVR